MKNYVRFATLSAVSLALAACGGGTSPAPERGVERPPLTGSIKHNVEAVLNGRYRDECETKYQSMQLEIAAALDTRAAEIEGLAPKINQNSIWKVVPMGKTFVRIRNTLPQPKDGWQLDDTYNWGQIYEYFKKSEARPTDEYWAWLNADAKSILLDDRSRTIDHGNYDLGKDDEPALLAVSGTVAKCLADPNCESLSLSQTENQFIQGSPFYAGKFKAIQLAQSRRSKRSALGELDLQIQSDLRNYSFKSNQSVRRTSANEIELPLDGTTFGDAQSQIAGYIESIWNRTGLRLKIKWIQPNEVPGAFRLFLDEGAGGRSFVSYQELAVHLYPYVRSRSIAHEIGHVLGFKDHYYTQWSHEKCGYVVQTSESDIMSDSSNGSVTDSEWKELDDSYPWSSK